ncbi:MAG: DUF4760 domain-containing protein [Candidatus Hermodarchaeia archaeon]|jgi:hypothetical protein
MDINLFSTIILDISIVAGVIFAIIQMRDATKTRHTGLVVQLNPALQASANDLIEASKILNREFNSYEEYIEKYGDPLFDKAFITIAAYYDGLGFLLHKRLIDVEIIEYILTGGITGAWKKLQPLIIEMRKDRHLPELLKWFEYLYEEMKKPEYVVNLSGTPSS